MKYLDLETKNIILKIYKICIADEAIIEFNDYHTNFTLAEKKINNKMKTKSTKKIFGVWRNFLCEKNIKKQ